MDNYYKKKLQQIMNLSTSILGMANNIDQNLKDGRIIDAYNTVLDIKQESDIINGRATDLVSCIEHDISKTNVFVSSLKEDLANYMTESESYDVSEYYCAYDYLIYHTDIELVHEYIKAFGIKSFYLKLSLLNK